MSENTTEIIAALDLESLADEQALLDKLHGVVRFFKVGLRLFTAHGRRAVELVHRAGGEVFLDLKLHDIPQTVAHAVQEAQKMGVASLSLHTLGGLDMLRAAAEVRPRPKLWGVTVLTSFSDADVAAIFPHMSAHTLALHLAQTAKAARLDGIICSGHEVRPLRKALGEDPCFIVPGIRPEGHAVHDQKRVVTPAQAVELGIRFAVVGRPITHDPEPRNAAMAVLAEIRNARLKG